MDPDAPIPYTITALGKRDLEFWRLEDQVESCDHRWRPAGRRLQCEHCSEFRDLPRGAGIPAYLSRKVGER